MKKIVFFVISALVLICISCDKYGNRGCEVAAVTLRYPEIKGADTLKFCVIKTEQNNLSAVVGVGKYEIINSNHFPLELNDIDHERYGYGEYFNDYIVYIENTEYRDTVTDIKIEWEEPCKVASCQYRFNGELHNGNGGFIDIYPRGNN